jgi:hypothetical protein
VVSEYWVVGRGRGHSKTSRRTDRQRLRDRHRQTGSRQARAVV